MAPACPIAGKAEQGPLPCKEALALRKDDITQERRNAMKRDLQGGRSLAAALLLGTLLLLGGCAAQLQERPSEDLTQTDIVMDVPAPAASAYDTREERVVLYFLDEEGMVLVPVSRTIAVEDGMPLAQAALLALCAGPLEGEAAYWPEIGRLSPERGFELSGGVATVNLPTRMRALSPEELYAVRMAIAHTLTEFAEVSYVSVLVGGREEGFDLAASMPVGALSRVEDLDVSSRYVRLDELLKNPQDAGISRLTVLRFPSLDGRWILPEVRSVTYAGLKPIECLYTVLEEIGRGTDNPLAMDVPAPMDYIEDMPEIIRYEDGAYRAIELRFSGELDDALEKAGLTRGAYLALLTDTLTGFVPGVDGVLVYIGGRPVTGLSAKDAPDGQERAFAYGLAAWEDFAGYTGAPGVMYLPEAEQGKLEAVSCIFPQELQFDAQRRLWQLTQQLLDRGVLTGRLSESDILAVHVEQDRMLLNLSGAYAAAMAQLTAAQERAAVYAIVNTLTQGTGVERVAFFFEGEQREALSGGLEMRGEFLRNPGMVVTK